MAVVLQFYSLGPSVTRFGKILKAFETFLRVYVAFGKILNLPTLGKNSDFFALIVVNGLSVKK